MNKEYFDKNELWLLIEAITILQYNTELKPENKKQYNELLKKLAKWRNELK